MSRSAPFMLCRLGLLCLALVAPIGAFAQTQATCTFKLFQLKPSTPTKPLTNGVNGTNDFGTVVGEAIFSNTGRGFIRYSGGGVTYFDAPNSVTTLFNARNNQGVSVGDYRDQSSLSSLSSGFMLSGSNFTSFDHQASVGGTHATGINKYNSIVGWYADSNDYGHGFKRWSNGSIINLDYPNTLATFVYGINDQGAVVGSYFDFGAALPHGFIYLNGQWATLDYPKTPGTELSGISNTGVIIGHARTLTSAQSFLYVNGTFKLINVPNSTMTEARGISANGLITGITDANGGSGFTAICH